MISYWPGPGNLTSKGIKYLQFRRSRFTSVLYKLIVQGSDIGS
jgi:hypothetical protein